MKKYTLFTLIVLVTFIGACSDRRADIGGMAEGEQLDSYLTEVVPPCVATEATPDPCPDYLPAQRQGSGVGYSGMMPWFEVPSFTERLLWDPEDDAFISVQIVVRGTVKPGTIRCKNYRARIPDYMVQYLPNTHIQDQYIVNRYHYSCFADVAVKEYIVGKGPSVLTVLLDRLGIHQKIDPDQKPGAGYLAYYGDPEKTSKSYEGREMIFFLGAAPSIVVEAWAGLGGGNMWFLQQTETGIRAVAEYYRDAILDKHRNKLNLPLDEMIADIKQAAINRDALTGGRIAVDPDLPMFVTDAHDLRDFYTSVGAVYDTTENATVLPPPVPGEGDPPAPTLPVNDGTTETTIPVPGEEETAPPATDDAGLSVGQTSTTTTETTTISSTTTTTVPSSTTEVAPADTVTTTTEVTETTTTTSAVTETVTGTTTTTTEAPNEESDPPPADDITDGEEHTTTTTTAPPAGEDSPPTETVFPTEELPTPTTTPPAGDDIPADTTDIPLPSDDPAPPANGEVPADNPGADELPTDGAGA